MEKQMIFHILGIEETKDETLIQDAYRNLLKTTHPEDDPEGFKRLREAYEAALSYARREETPEEEKEKTEIDLWIDQVDALYQDILSRPDPQEWREVLSDPVCLDLDTSLDAREAFLVYLMDHVYLPQAVWKVIDGVFQIVEEQESLTNQFPRDFIQYIVYYIQNEEFIDYDLFRVDNRQTLDGDAYIRGYLNLKRQVDQGQIPEQLDAWMKAWEDLKAFGVYHPYPDAEYLRVLSIALEKNAKPESRNAFVEKASQLADQLLEEYREDLYIRLNCGLARWNTGREEEAFQLWSSLLEEVPTHYSAKYYCIRWLIKTQDYLTAKQYLLDLLDLDGNDETLTEQMRTVNDALILHYGKQIASPDRTEAEKTEDTLELCWCLFQNDQLPKALEILAHVTPHDDLRYTYENLYGRILYRDGQYEEALPHLKAWLRLIEETVDDGTDEMKKRISRRFRALHILSGCCHELGQRDEALRYVDLAKEAAGNTGDKIAAMQYRAYLLFQYKSYQQCIDACDQVIAEDDDYYPAYLQRQEAAYELQRGQQVVDDYYNAIRIFPGYYKPYMLAAEVFFYFNQFEDAKGVLDRARENQVSFSPNMKLFEIKILRNLAENKEQREEPLRLAKELLTEIKKLQENPEAQKKQTGNEDPDASPAIDIEDLSEVEFEIAILHWDNDDCDPAMEHLKKAMEQNPTRQQYNLIQGHIYLDQKEYQKALNSYAKAEDDYQDSPSLYYNRGICHQKLGAKELARECFEKTLELQEGYRDTCEMLANYYKDRYQRSCAVADYIKALDYINRQLAVSENCYYLVERGRLYMAAFQLDLAIADYEKALTYVPDDWAAFNNIGCCYKYKGEFEKAIGYFEKSLECLTEQKNLLPYSNMADCYEALRNYEKAVECYEKDLELFPNQKSFHAEIGNLCTYMGQYKKALSHFREYANDEDYCNNMCLLYLKKKQLWRGILLCKQLVSQAKKADEKAHLWYRMGTFMAEHTDDLKRALAYLQKGLALDASPHHLHDLHWMAALVLFRMGRREEARIHAQKSMEAFSKMGYASEAEYLEYGQYRPARLMRHGWLEICLGNTEKGISLLEDMRTCHRCRLCRHPGCYESYLYLGWYYEAAGNYSMALDFYEKAYAITDQILSLPDSIARVRSLTEKQ